MNYFELFDIPITLNVDKKILAQKYFELQKKYHPDFFTNATEDEQEDALEQSSQINKALKIFKNDDETIKYVLELRGILEPNEKYQLPPDFLMEVMELNENLSENSQGAIQQFETDIYAPVQAIIENYGPETSPESLQKVKEYYFKKKYLQRILDRLPD